MMDEVGSGGSCSSLTTTTGIGNMDDLEISNGTWNGGDSGTTTDMDGDSGVAVASKGEPKTGKIEVPEQDVAPVFILQPKEITKNIDLMKTVALLMESQLQQPFSPKKLDLDKLKDLYNDIHRFPEAFQKFVSIIHQIQYLNVTSDWDHSTEERSVSSVSQPLSSLSSRGSIMSRLFGSDKHRNSSVTTECDKRKKVMLHLLNVLEQVFNRYLKIQGTLEERLKKFHELLKITEQSTSKQYERTRNSTTDSDDDDPNLPLLVASAKRNSEKLWLEKVEGLHTTLRRTKRSAREVQDSLEVLRDLILWDYKQAVSSSTINTDEGNSSAGNTFNGHFSHSTCIEVGLQQCSRTSDDFQSYPSSSRQRGWIISALLGGIIVVLVIMAALSLMRFHY